jgi:endonuclease/exonuclease/phosphatase family metal-dependent hydrolase
MTYNVEGLPWPIAWGRAEALGRIGERLRAMRRSGGAPQVVVLQEAFSDEARSIGRRAGYRYIVDGPEVSDAGARPMTAADTQYLAAGHWWRGEVGVRLVGSGLLLLSDYPIRRIRRMAFPRFACAGFDCLANKGALLVTLDIPGAAAPVDVVTTHLNSRRSSKAGDARSLQAYRRQVGLLTSFIEENHDRAFPLIVAGDFNVGAARPRWAALHSQIAEWSAGDRFGNALLNVAERRRARGQGLSPGFAAAIRRGTDWQFFASGRTARLDALAVNVPFAREPGGGMLSDHIGYTTTFRVASTVPDPSVVDVPSGAAIGGHPQRAINPLALEVEQDSSTAG